MTLQIQNIMHVQRRMRDKHHWERDREIEFLFFTHLLDSTWSDMEGALHCPRKLSYFLLVDWVLFLTIQTFQAILEPDKHWNSIEFAEHKQQDLSRSQQETVLQAQKHKHYVQ